MTLERSIELLILEHRKKADLLELERLAAKYGKVVVDQPLTST